MSPCPKHGCTPNNTLPHESDDEDGPCAELGCTNDETAANIEGTESAIPMSPIVINVKQEMSPLPDKPVYV